MKPTTRASQPFRFLNLPPELRLRIYGYVFTLLPPIIESLHDVRTREPSAIFQVCKQIRAEANKEFFAWLKPMKADIYGAQNRVHAKCDELFEKSKARSNGVPTNELDIEEVDALRNFGRLGQRMGPALALRCLLTERCGRGCWMQQAAYRTNRASGCFARRDEGNPDGGCKVRR